jgi:hypothetical protein
MKTSIILGIGIMACIVLLLFFNRKEKYTTESSTPGGSTTQDENLVNFKSEINNCGTGDKTCRRKAAFKLITKVARIPEK